MKFFTTILFISICNFSFAQNDFVSYFNEGSKKYLDNNFEEAITDFNSALKNKATAKDEYQIANLYVARAYCKMYLGKYTLAINDINDAIKIKPEYSELYFALTTIHLYNNKYDEAIKYANKGLLLKPSYEELIILKARAEFSKKNYAAALSDIDTILINFNPRNIEALNLQGSVRRTKKEYNEGIESFTKVIEYDAQNAVAFFDRGICKACVKDFDGALGDMKRGMEIDSSLRFIGNNNIAFFIKFDQKDFSGAIPLFNEAIEQNPKFAYAYCNRGYAKLQLNDLVGAREDINKSIALSANNSYAYKNLALLLLAENKTKQACENLKRASELGYTEEYDDEVTGLLKEHCK